MATESGPYNVRHISQMQVSVKNSDGTSHTWRCVPKPWKERPRGEDFYPATATTNFIKYLVNKQRAIQLEDIKTGLIAENWSRKPHSFEEDTDKWYQKKLGGGPARIYKVDFVQGKRVAVTLEKYTSASADPAMDCKISTSQLQGEEFEANLANMKKMMWDF